MKTTKLPVETIDGRSVQIEIDTDGRFSTYVDDHNYTADTLGAMREKLRRAFRTTSTRIKIEVSLLHSGDGGWRSRRESPAAEPAIITGIHGGNKNILVKRADGKTEQSGHNEYVFARRLSEADAKHWVALCEVQKDAKAAVEKFKEDHEIDNILKFVTDAVEAATPKGGTP